MKKLIFKLLICIFALMVNTLQIFAQLPKNDPTWKLVFEDNFDSLGLSSSHWNQSDWRCGLYSFYDETLDSCFINRTHHTTDNSNLLFDTIGSGKITIRSERENVSVYSRNECDTTNGMHNFDFTTAAWLQSNDHFKYGYFEIRCKLPSIPIDSTSYGLGPNFWLYENPDSVDGICYSEIDIFEFVTDYLPPNYDNHIYTCNSHFTQCSDGIPHNDPFSNGSLQFTDFHTFALNWTPSEMQYYKDDALIYTSYNHPDSLIPMNIILDVNIPTDQVYPVASTLLPYNYEIDYVKVWQPSEKCDSSITCNFNAATYNNTKVNSVSIGGSNCTATVGQTDNVTLKAIDYIEFKEGFEVEPGGMLNAEIENCFSPVYTKSAPPTRQPYTFEIPKELINKFFNIR